MGWYHRSSFSSASAARSSTLRSNLVRASAASETSNICISPSPRRLATYNAASAAWIRSSGEHTAELAMPTLEILGVQLSTVKSRVHEGFVRLRRLVEEGDCVDLGGTG
jgi:hypothetical protein